MGVDFTLFDATTPFEDSGRATRQVLLQILPVVTTVSASVWPSAQKPNEPRKEPKFTRR
jgi:hypothetical protein